MATKSLINISYRLVLYLAKLILFTKANSEIPCLLKKSLTIKCLNLISTLRSSLSLNIKCINKQNKNS